MNHVNVNTHHCVHIYCSSSSTEGMANQYAILKAKHPKVGRTSLSLALGNMVVARQILLVFNLSYLPCSVQIVNKN